MKVVRFRTLSATHILYAILVLMFIAFSVLSPNFFSAYNITSMLSNIAYLGILTGPMALLMISGCIDISVGGAVGLLTSLMALLYNVKTPIPAVVILLIGIVVGVGIGALNGFLVAGVRLDSIIVTLGTMAVTYGIGYVITGGISVQMLEPITSFIGLGNIFGVPTAVILLILFYVAIGLVLSRSKFGRKVQYIGINERASNLAGVNIARVRFTLYLLSGFAVGLSSLILIGQSGVGMPQLGTGLELQAITAALLGGVAFTGGKGTIPGVLAGVLILGVLFTGFTIIGFQYIQIEFFQGVILIAVVALYEGRQKRGATY